MPRLDDETAQKVADAETTNFEPIDPGVYHCRLVEVESKPGKAADYWRWEYEVVSAPYIGRKLWTNTSLSEAALFKVHESFDAYSAEYGSDTDDLIGQVVKLVVSIKPIQEGPRKGELKNEIDRVLPASEDFQPEDGARDTAGSPPVGGKKEDLF